MLRKLTKRQQGVLKAIVGSLRRRGFPPTLRELQEETGISTPRGVVVHLQALEKKGYIRRDSSARGIRVLIDPFQELEEEVLYLPLVGQIAAGTPILAEENIEAWIPIPRQLVGRRRDAFLLRVRGDSMKEAHILDGDLVIVQPQATAEHGEIVVALLEDEATVKRFCREGGKLMLKPAHPEYPSLEVKEGVLLQGKVIGVIRDSVESHADEREA